MSSELTADELAMLAALLARAEHDLEQGLSISSADAKPVDLELSIGRLSRVDALQQQHMALARRQRVSLQLQQVRAARLRMTGGTYGECIACGEMIGLARLKAKPEVALCRDCQSRGDG